MLCLYKLSERRGETIKVGMRRYADEDDVRERERRREKEGKYDDHVAFDIKCMYL